MNNTHALLLAFIEASGYEVEEVKHIQHPDDHRTLIGCREVIDYKVTKKKDTSSEESIQLRNVIKQCNEYNRELYLANQELKADLERWRNK